MNTKFINEVKQLANELGEDNPTVIFHIASYLAIPQIYQQKTTILAEAHRLHDSGNMLKDGSRQRTLGGCWFIQVDDYRSKAWKVRRTIRERTNTPKHTVPTEFLAKLH